MPIYVKRHACFYALWVHWHNSPYFIFATRYHSALLNLDKTRAVLTIFTRGDSPANPELRPLTLSYMQVTPRRANGAYP
jgi:hypothetical protein